MGERARIAAGLADLPASLANVRKVLNELQAIVEPNGAGGRDRR